MGAKNAALWDLQGCNLTYKRSFELTLISLCVRYFLEYHISSICSLLSSITATKIFRSDEGIGTIDFQCPILKQLDFQETQITQPQWQESGPFRHNVSPVKQRHLKKSWHWGSGLGLGGGFFASFYYGFLKSQLWRWSHQSVHLYHLNRKKSRHSLLYASCQDISTTHTVSTTG